MKKNLEIQQKIVRLYIFPDQTPFPLPQNIPTQVVRFHATARCNRRTCAVSHSWENLLPAAVAAPGVAICLNSQITRWRNMKKDKTGNYSLFQTCQPLVKENLETHEKNLEILQKIVRLYFPRSNPFSIPGTIYLPTFFLIYRSDIFLLRVPGFFVRLR